MIRVFSLVPDTKSHTLVCIKAGASAAIPPGTGQKSGTKVQRPGRGRQSLGREWRTPVGGARVVGGMERGQVAWVRVGLKLNPLHCAQARRGSNDPALQAWTEGQRGARTCALQRQEEKPTLAARRHFDVQRWVASGRFLLQNSILDVFFYPGLNFRCVFYYRTQF